jgi:hypothetical protein
MLVPPANIALCYVPGEGAWFTTWSAACRRHRRAGRRGLAEAVVQRLLPLARSKLGSTTSSSPTSSRSLEGRREHEELIAAGKRMATSNLAFTVPDRGLLNERELRHVKRSMGSAAVVRQLSQRRTRGASG